MNVFLEVKFGNTVLNIEPLKCVGNENLCNESLMHVEDTLSVTLEYDPDLFELLTREDSLSAILKDRNGGVLFTGEILTDVSWQDMGNPFPIENLPVTVRDYTSKLQVKSSSDIALENTSFFDVVSFIATECNLSVSGIFPEIDIPYFVIEKDREFLSVLDLFCYQHRQVFRFDNVGGICVFGFDQIPQNPELLSEADIVTPLGAKKSQRKYVAVKVQYNTVTEKLNELVYKEAQSYDDENQPIPVILQSGVYYPFESDPVIEATEGQVFQSFEAGFAQTVKKYNGELDYRRSKGTTILFTKNQTVVPDWSGSVQIDRTDFTPKGSSVRIRNLGTTDAIINQFAIRADAIYRNGNAYSIAGTETDGKTLSVETEFIFDSVTAEMLARALYRYQTLGNFSLTIITDDGIIEPGTFRHLDTGLSGFMADILFIRAVHDYETEITTHTVLSVGSAAVDVQRFKTRFNDDSRGQKGDPGKKGDPGNDTTVYSISSASPVLAKSVAGVFTPAAASFSFFSTTGTAAPVPYAGYWKIYETTDGSTWVLKETASANATSKSSAPTNSAVKGIKCELYAAGGVTTLLDTMSVMVVSDGSAGSSGADAISGIVQNESHTVPADSDGNVSSYSGSGTELRVYEGATLLAYDGVGTANGTWKVTAAGTGITPGGISDSGAFATVAIHSAMPAGTAIATILYTITGKTSAGVSFSFTKSQTITKAKTGAQGATGAAGPEWPTLNYVVDLSNTAVYNADTYYPVVGSAIPTGGLRRIKCSVQLNSGTKPSWSTHNNGFTVNLDLQVTASGWGTTNAYSIILQETYSFATANPASYTQMTNSSFPVFWLRGGGKYFISADFASTWSPKSSAYTNNSQTVTPTTTRPAVGAITLADTGYVDGVEKSTLGIGVKKGYSSFTTIDDGECYIHGFTTAGVAADVPGFIYFDEKKLTVTNAMINPNYALDGYILLPVAGGAPVVGFFRISNQTWYSIVEGTFTALTEASWLAIGEMINTGAEVTESVSLYPRAVRLSEVRIALKQQFLGIAGAVTNGSGSASLYQTTSAPYKFSASAVGKRARPGDCVFVRGGTLVQAGTSDSIKALRVFDGYYWEAPRTEDYLKYRSMALIDLASASRVYKANGVAIPADIDAAYDVLVTNVLMAEKIKTLEIQFEEFVASIAGNTLVPRSGSTPGTRQVYMGKNPRYPNDASREYEFALQEYLGLVGTKEVWMKHFWTKALSGSLVGLTLLGGLQSCGKIESSLGSTWEKIDSIGSSNQYDIDTDGTRIFCLKYGGVYRSIDKGNSWTEKTIATGVYMRAVVVGPIVITSHYDAKIIYYSTNNGEGWTAVDLSAVISSPIVDLAFDGSSYYGITVKGEIIKTTNGSSWLLVRSAQTSSTTYLSAGINVEDNTIAITYFDGTNYRFGVSTNAGGSFNIYTLSIQSGEQWGSRPIFSNGRIFIGSTKGRVAVTANQGSSFLYYNTQVASRIVSLCSFGDLGIIALGSCVQVSVDGGETWKISDDRSLGINIYNNVSQTACYIESEQKIITCTGYVAQMLEAGGGVVGKVYDATRGELNKLWDGRYFPSYANVADVAPKLYKYFAPGTTQATVYNALSPYLNPAVGSNAACMASWNGVELTRIFRNTATMIRFADNGNGGRLDINQGNTGTLVASLQVEILIYQA